jgi:hypothetical protein
MNREAEDRFFQSAQSEANKPEEDAGPVNTPAALPNPIKPLSPVPERR